MKFDLIRGIAVLLLMITPIVHAEEVTITLKNGKLIKGSVVQEEPNFILLNTDMGQLIVDRANIQSSGTVGGFALSDTTRLNDQVVVYLTNDKVVDGFLIAKSRAMIMIQTEMGRLTIPKNEVMRIEYISSAFAERGEAVLVELINGKRIDGYLFAEDQASLTVLTELGSLTINKAELRSLSYNIDPKFKTPAGIKPDENSPLRLSQSGEKNALSDEKMQDVFGLGYSNSFGDDYDTGIILSYARRLKIQEFPSFSLNGIAGIDVPFFSINQDVFTASSIPGGTTVQGYALLPSLVVGTPITFYPQASSHYRFVITPELRFFMVRRSLKIDYSSFPDLNTKESSTDFRFGVGANLKFEWDVTQSMTLGLGFNPNLIFGDDGYSATFISLGVAPLF